MALGILVLITALSISAVAIYYSIAGLVAIFAAAAVPIMIMGGVLEVGKLVTAVWLHKYWSQAKWWLKYYLATAVLVLMFITSMGIFGFLSKAHIEQTSASIESVENLGRIETEIARLGSQIVRAEEKIVKAENFIEIYVNTSLEECERRDVKGLYKKARTGEVKNMTGISKPYQVPLNPDLEVVTDGQPIEKSIKTILEYVHTKLK